MPESPINRRQMLKILAAAAGATFLSNVPTKWKTPVVEVGMLPAHAQISGLGAISGTVTITLPAGAPVRGNSPLPPPPTIPVSVLTTGLTTNAAFDHSSNGIAYFPYTIINVPAGTYTVRCTYCGVNHDNAGVVVHALATTSPVDFGAFDECIPCLSADALIDTPMGAVRITDLKVGMSVWTLDATGLRVPGVIAQTIRRPVPPNATIMHLMLSDGRDVSVSAPHPTTDGRTIGDLVVGDTLDGARVIRAESIPYDQPAKYDLLPAGETGSYWANGIPMNSTIDMREKRRILTLA